MAAYPTMQCMIIAGILREEREVQRGKPGFIFAASVLDRLVLVMANRLERDSPQEFDRAAFYKLALYQDRMGLRPAPVPGPLRRPMEPEKVHGRFVANVEPRKDIL